LRIRGLWSSDVAYVAYRTLRNVASGRYGHVWLNVIEWRGEAIVTALAPPLRPVAYTTRKFRVQETSRLVGPPKGVP